MRKSFFLLLCFLAVFAQALFGQTRTVDNFTLDKYKQQRLSAEKDLRENYAKLGFPSPEELERQRKEDAAKTDELLDKLRQEDLEQQRIDLERQRVAIDAARLQQESQPQVVVGNGYDSVYGSGYYSNYGGRYHSNRGRRNLNPYVYGPMVRVTPVGVTVVGNPQPPRPMFARPRTTPRGH